MVDREVSSKECEGNNFKKILPMPKDITRKILVDNDGYSKLIYLRRSIIDADATCEKIRRLVNSINQEIYIANEDIRSKLLANQKRLDLLREANDRLERYETSRLLSYEEFVSIIKLDNVYDNLLYDNNNCNKKDDYKERSYDI